MIVVTGAAGFIGSCMVSKLNAIGKNALLLVDDFSPLEKTPNLKGKKFSQQIDRSDFIDWFKQHAAEVTFVYHLGARTDTTEFNVEIFNKLNLNYSKSIWEICIEHDIPLVYASSAATYGLGEWGYSDNHELIEKLKPLNPYGDSKNDFDKWVLKQTKFPPFWAGLKFFNVYGPNEFHKARMASVIFHAFNQISEHGSMKLFRSHKPEYKDGEQLRDFVYVKDVIDVCYFLQLNQPVSGIYNLGSGKARTFLDLTRATFDAMLKQVNITFIDTPQDIRESYQYFTEASMQKLRDAGYTAPFYSLEAGVKEYVQNYLLPHSYY